MTSKSEQNQKLMQKLYSYNIIFALKKYLFIN